MYTVLEFAQLPSYGLGPVCPICGTRKTMPVPGCNCRYFNTNHIMAEHHDCKFPKQFRSRLNYEMDRVIK